MTPRQVVAARDITAWYLERYHGTDHDMGTARTFTDPTRVGHFAVSRDALAAGEPDALFRLLVACTMFQRRQDQQILRVLRGISQADVSEMTDLDGLVGIATSGLCANMATTDSLKRGCDLSKNPTTGEGQCASHPDTRCPLKRYTVLLKRYGHFGKVPTSAALAVREAGAKDLAELYRATLESAMTPAQRAAHLESSLTRAWRVSDKIAAMYLSILCNPDLSGLPAPWERGVDWTCFVAIDSNVDLFLDAIGYEGRRTYRARRSFMQRLAARVPLAELKPGLSDFNPRVVQQAAYVFMSKSNRRANSGDCVHYAPKSCGECKLAPTELCGLRLSST